MYDEAQLANLRKVGPRWPPLPHNLNRGARRFSASVSTISPAVAGARFLVRQLLIGGRSGWMTRAASTTHSDVTLSVASASDGLLLGNLLELYIHDLSAVFDVTLGPQGRFGYPQLESYLSGSDDKLPFLIRCQDVVAGFALVTRGSPVVADPDVFDLAEYFVLRRFRGRGLGRSAAGLLWDRLPAVWTVRAAVIHADAVAFWRGAVTAYAGAGASESMHHRGDKDWVVFSFDSAGRP